MVKQILRAGPTILLALFLSNCTDTDGQKSPAPAETPPPTQLKRPFVEAMNPDVYELPSQALATWRDFAKYRPTLVLFSTHPLLDPIPEDRLKPIARLLRDGTREEIVQRSRLLSSNPAALPPEAVSAALANGFFSELVIVLPDLKKPEEVSLDRFRERALKAGFLNEFESAGLSLKDGVISGTIRNTPLRVVHPERLPKSAKPIVLHVDLGYFKDMYVNEVKTPAYGLLYQLATKVREANYLSLSTTLSYSNQEVNFSMESRFLIRDLAAILRKPELLSGNTPASWALRTNALYQFAMFNTDKGRELLLQAAESAPEDAAAHYALSIELFSQNSPEQGFATLDRAVALDKGYALEYLSLAEQGFKMGKRDKSLELLEKAARAFPENPFIRINLANQLIQTERVKDARPIIAELRKLKWSDSIYPQIPELLKQMEEAASIDPVFPPVPASIPQPSDSPVKKPTGGMPGFNHMGMGSSTH